MRRRILIVEDDPALAEVVRDNLLVDGFDVTVARNGDEAIGFSRANTPDLILLDLMLPGSDGFKLCGLLRANGRVPIIIVSARGQKADKLQGLHVGADDYVTKPFDMEELVARITAVLRRTKHDIGSVRLGRTVIDFENQRAYGPDGEIHLTQRDFDVLRYLAARNGRVVRRDEILREVWGFNDPPTTRSVDNAVAKLRKKLEDDPHAPKFIHTAFGDGYRITFDLVDETPKRS
ncbi:MAG TPA: response regulator transcription factor [Vicinamibacterales bacterium]|nr:response regulator transcription factor [Vicinamibacterales bacterium]